jgi:predicted nucleic acid-binding protein
VAEDGPTVTGSLLSLLLAVACSGKQVHDANIVATMLAQGITRLLTHNTSDFSRFHAWISVIPVV